MKYKALFTTAVTSCLLLTSTGYAMQESGQNNRVEWQVRQQWPTRVKAVDMVHSLDGKYVYILNDNKEVEIFSQSGQFQGSIPVDPGVSAIDIAPQGEALYLIDNTKETYTTLDVSFVVDVDITGAPFRGPADAPVTIALFTDFECPYCKKIEPLLEEVLKRNPTTVKLAFKNMPLRFHKMADPAARAALAADEQGGKFWEFHDKLFSAPKLSDELIDDIAEELNLDVEKLRGDMASTKITSKIQKDIIDAQNAGVTGTPTIFINGRTPHQRSLEGFQTIIDEELAKKGK